MIISYLEFDKNLIHILWASKIVIKQTWGHIGFPKFCGQYVTVSICIIILKRGRQCKAEREWYTPYQYEDPSPTIPTYRQKKEKEKNSRRLL